MSKKLIINKEEMLNHNRMHTFLISSAFVSLVVLYMVVALIQDALPFSVNRLIGAAIIVVLSADFLIWFTRNRALAICAVGILFVVHVGITTTSRVEELEFFIYWIAALLALCYVGSGKNIEAITDVVRRNKNFFCISVIASSLLVAALLVTRTGYVISWGEGTYFKGLCNTEHTMASVCCLVMTLSFLCYKCNAMRALMFSSIGFVMTWALLQTGARTFLIPLVVIWILFIQDSINQRWLRLLLYSVLAITLMFVFLSSGMSSKFNYLAGDVVGGSFLNVITSGRIGYWTTDLGAFLREPPFMWLLGNSASYVYDLNWVTFYMRIWAHNDFVMLICSVGILGLSLYLLSLQVFFRGVRNRIAGFAFECVLLFVLFPAVINGFYSYQHLLYAAVFLVCAVCCAKGKYKNKSNKSIRIE